MYEYSAQYDLTGPDGQTLTLNAAPGNGIVCDEVTGFDMPTVRSAVIPNPEADGASAGDFYFGQRSITFAGYIGVDLTATERNQMVVNMQRVARALRGDILIEAQSSGLPAMQVLARLEQPMRVTGQGMLKRWFLSFVCVDPRIYSQALNTETGNPGAPAGGGFPWDFPVSFGGTVSSVDVGVANAGNFDTPPVITVTGPAGANWEIEGANGEKLYVDGLALSSGESVVLDHTAHTAVRNDGVNVYAYVRFPDSVWWLLPPGSTTVKLWATGTSGATALDVDWRDAWA